MSSKRCISCGFVWLFFLSMMFVGCSQQTEAWLEMDEAEVLMKEKPDSSLVSLNNIKTSSLQGKKEKARYALLKSMALDKNYIDTTNFDVLQPAIDYYPNHGTEDEKLRTYYYQGRIYQNMDNPSQALECFLKGEDLEKNITDSIVFAHLLTAQGTIYFRQYNTDKLIDLNLRAGDIYMKKGSVEYGLKGYLSALDAANVKRNKSLCDSIMKLVDKIIEDYPQLRVRTLPSVITYKIKYSSKQELEKLLDSINEEELPDYIKISVANGYNALGEGEKALAWLTHLSVETADSLRYTSILMESLELTGDYAGAFKTLQTYSRLSERQSLGVIRDDAVFAEKRHKLETENLRQINKKNSIIWGCVSGVVIVVSMIGWLLTRQRLLRTEKERIEERASLLELQNKLNDEEKEKLKAEMVALRLIKQGLEEEKEDLANAVNQQKEIGEKVKKVLQERVGILNGLLSQELSSPRKQQVPLDKRIAIIYEDRLAFIKSTREAFEVSHPGFIKHLISRGLTEEEINYVCLYAVGLNGKNVGEYMKMKGHYNLSSVIRKKLGLDEHSTNLGIYIRRLLNEEQGE
ncbi:MAG: hypothetical protein K2J48_03760 [Muribaculaceae bacterium]|nr:hypothetical protein [Muribaculaceae bacterium]